MNRSLRIAVIGAGLAGLTAALELEKKGFDVSLFEARGRAGGRMQTLDQPKQSGTVETGGTFIDVEHQAIRDLAEELDVQIIKVNTDEQEFHYQWINGKLTTSPDNFKRFYSTIVKLEKDKSALENDKSFADTMHNKYLSDYLLELEVSSTFYQLLEMAARNELGSDLTELQASQVFDILSFDVEKEQFQIDGSLGDECLVLKGGSRELLQKVTSKLKKPINFVHQLTKIDTSIEEKPVLTFINQGEEKVFSFDRVVLALPLPVLKDQVELKIPNLPASIKNVVENVSYGKNGKYIVFFDKPIWLSYPTGAKFNFICKDFWIWDNSDHLLGNNLYGLTGFSGGSSLDRLETLSDDEIASEILSNLEQVIPDIRNHYRGFLRADKWHTNPYTMGSYEGKFLPGQDDPMSDLQDASFGPIFFAGSSWNFQYGGFMNGAVISAKQTAEKISSTSSLF